MGKLIYLCDDYRHLICLPYSLDNLHQMAEELDIKRCWFHKNHYDIPKMRIEEIQNKCHRIISPRRVVKIIKNHCKHKWSKNGKMCLKCAKFKDEK